MKFLVIINCRSTKLFKSLWFCRLWVVCNVLATTTVTIHVQVFKLNLEDIRHGRIFQSALMILFYIWLLCVFFQTCYQCPQCSNVMSTKQGYDQHMRRHMGTYRYTCHYCSKGFSSKKDMMQHMTIHTNQNYFKCKFCEQTFRYHIARKNHERQCQGQDCSRMASVIKPKENLQY